MMPPRMLLTSALRSLYNHKLRSLLTTLGIIIGVVAIIIVMSIGQGAKQKVQQQIERLGTNFILVLAAAPKNVLQRGGVNLTLKKSDLAAVISECDAVGLISPGVQAPNKVICEGANWQTMVSGVNDLYLQIRDWPLQRGDFFTQQDVRSGSKVAVLGQTVYKELFGTTDPIGTTIRIKKLPFKVIGVLTEKGRGPDGRDFDDAIFAPITTVQRKLLGTNNYAAFIMSAISKDLVGKAAQQVRGVLRQQHRLSLSDEDDFTLFTQDDIAQASDAASMVLNILMMIIASISLIVGGVGIMNIMLVSVTERTKEIGLRMAIGATTQAILTQFILEAVAICLAGGLLGVILGVTCSESIGTFLGWPIVISQSSILISLASSLLIGLFFGYYPAYKASQLDPVDALLDR